MRELGSAKLLLDAKAALGECPLWSDTEQALYWVDISGRAIHRLKVATGRDESRRGMNRDECWTMPAEPGCIGLAESGGLVAALRDGFYRFFPDPGALNKIADAPYDAREFRFNDGRCDQQGRFWAGAMFEPRTATRAGVFCLERGVPRAGWGSGDGDGWGVKVSNGMAFSVDGRTVYQSDTPNHVIYQFAFDPVAGVASARREFARVAANRDAADYGGRPDGAAVDADGNYWSAQYEGGRVLRFAPSGEVTGIVRVPARRTTMVAFGGAHMKTLFITTARDGASAAELAHDPHAGGVFSIEVEVAGLPSPRYVD
jgi:sugar lactone lactonase YvrE